MFVVVAFSIEFLCSYWVNLILDNFAKIVNNANIDVVKGKAKYRVFHVIGHQENCSYEHIFQLMGFLKASMEPQDQAQITIRSEIYSIVFSVGQEGDCLEERISRSGDFSTIYSVYCIEFWLPYASL